LNRIFSPIEKMTHLGMGCWRRSPKQKSTGRRFGSGRGGKGSQIGWIQQRRGGQGRRQLSLRKREGTGTTSFRMPAVVKINTYEGQPKGLG
jgi:hypothetical protein